MTFCHLLVSRFVAGVWLAKLPPFYFGIVYFLISPWLSRIGTIGSCIVENASRRDRRLLSSRFYYCLRMGSIHRANRRTYTRMEAATYEGYELPQTRWFHQLSVAWDLREAKLCRFVFNSLINDNSLIKYIVWNIVDICKSFLKEDF